MPGALGGQDAARWGAPPPKKDPRAIGEVLGMDEGHAQEYASQWSSKLRTNREIKPAWAARVSDYSPPKVEEKKYRKYKDENEVPEDANKPVRRSRKHGKELALQLSHGWCEANILLLTMDEIGHLADSIRKTQGKLQYIKLLCVPKRRVKYHEEKHRLAVVNMAEVVRHRRVSGRLQAALVTSLRLSQTLVDLEIGTSLPEDVMRSLGNALAHNKSVRRLSFAGSHMGDLPLAEIIPGLRHNTGLEELDLTACHLTDRSGALVSQVVKSHSARRAVAHWEETLRLYGPSDPVATRRMHNKRKFKVPMSGKSPSAFVAAVLQNSKEQRLDTAGGWLVLKLGDNMLTDNTVRNLCEALRLDEQLVNLGLKGNRLTKAASKEMHALMQDHPALVRVDLRQNLAEMGVMMTGGLEPSKSRATGESAEDDIEPSALGGTPNGLGAGMGMGGGRKRRRRKHKGPLAMGAEASAASAAAGLFSEGDGEAGAMSGLLAQSHAVRVGLGMGGARTRASSSSVHVVMPGGVGMAGLGEGGGGGDGLEGMEEGPMGVDGVASLRQAHSKLQAASAGAGAEEAGLVEALTDALGQLESAIDRMAPTGTPGQGAGLSQTMPVGGAGPVAGDELLEDIATQLQRQCDLFDRIGQPIR